MKKGLIIGIIVVLIIIALVVIFYNKPVEEENSLSMHTCLFNNETLDLNCSSELRIKIGYERFLTEEPIDIGNGAIAYYYDAPIYSKSSNSNLNEIYKGMSDLYITNIAGQKYRQCSNCPIPTNQEPEAFFTTGLFIYKDISVLDIETNETFTFFVSDSKLYNLDEITNYSLALNSIQKCNEEMITGNKTDGCAGYSGTYWRNCLYSSNKLYSCFINGSYLMDYFSLSREEAKDLCFSFVHKGFIANCLRTLSVSQEEINECINFASGDEYLIAICNLKQGETLNSSFLSKRITDYI